jgi:hypothetical protein
VAGLATVRRADSDLVREMGGIASDEAFRRLAQMMFPQLSGAFVEQSRDCATSLTEPLALA